MNKSTKKKEIPNYSLKTLSKKECNFLLVIPVINEGERIIRALKRIQKLELPVDILIADGGSSDNSTDPDTLSSLGVDYLLKLEDRGKLSAQLQCAFYVASTFHYDGIITMDGNDKDDPIGTWGIIEKLDLGFDFVQGSRFLPGGKAENTPIFRHLSIRFVHAPLTSLGAGKWMTDTTNGFRGFSMKMIESEEIDIFRQIFSGYSLIAYLPVRAGRMGFRIVETPVSRSYPKIGKTPTKIRGLSGNFNILKVLAQVLIGRFNP
jgi:glycosyltransferase involved in cell wall biosynthesis